MQNTGGCSGSVISPATRCHTRPVHTSIFHIFYLTEETARYRGRRSFLSVWYCMFQRDLTSGYVDMVKWCDVSDGLACVVCQFCPRSAAIDACLWKTLIHIFTNASSYWQRRRACAQRCHLCNQRTVGVLKIFSMLASSKDLVVWKRTRNNDWQLKHYLFYHLDFGPLQVSALIKQYAQVVNIF